MFALITVAAQTASSVPVHPLQYLASTLTYLIHLSFNQSKPCIEGVAQLVCDSCLTDSKSEGFVGHP